MSDFYLVQRCKRAHTIDPSNGFDGFFRLDYMGSSEYECGTVSESLKRLRAEADLTRKRREITIGGVTRAVWFVGSLATMKEKVDAFEAWVASGERSLDGAYYTENHTGRDSSGKLISDFMIGTVLWWALDADIMFTFDVAVADLALTAVNTSR